MRTREEKQRLKEMSFLRSNCAVACTLDLIGDKWTLLIIRDLFFGKTKFNEFQQSAERIPTNILARRLEKLGRLGLVSKAPYQDRPVRYEYRLTESGRSLGPVIQSIMHWGREHIPGAMAPNQSHQR